MPTKKPGGATPSTSEHLDTGLDVQIRTKFAGQLSEILDDTYTLLVRTHVYHWNVKGPLFEPIHKLLEAQYEELFEATDKIAERVRQLGHKVPEGQGHFPRGLDIPATMPNEVAMVTDLMTRHEKVSRRLRETSTQADDDHDYVTQDIVNELLAFHEKSAWMLRSIVTRWPAESTVHAQAAE